MISSPLDSAITLSSNTYKSGSTFFMHKKGLLANKKNQDILSVNQSYGTSY